MLIKRLIVFALLIGLSSCKESGENIGSFDVKTLYGITPEELAGTFGDLTNHNY